MCLLPEYEHDSNTNSAVLFECEHMQLLRSLQSGPVNSFAIKRD